MQFSVRCFHRILAPAVASLVVLVAGCGSDDGATVTAEAVAPAATAVAPTATTAAATAVAPTATAAAATAAATAEPTEVATPAPSATAVPADAASSVEFTREGAIQLLLDGGLDETQAACIADGNHELTGSWDLRAEVASTVEEQLSAMAFACIEPTPEATVAPVENLSDWLSDAGTLAPADRVNLYPGRPPSVLAAGSGYQAVIMTSDGEMRFDLFASEAPVTVNSFLTLASDGYYNDVTFHRVIADFMAQGGDPSGTGTGGPGYQFENEYTPGIEFDQRGRLAMANSGPNTNGSQFFITYAPLDFLEASDYTIFGQLIDGDDILAAIEMRDPASATEPGTTITSIRVTETG